MKRRNLRLFEDRRPNNKKNNNKMSSDMEFNEKESNTNHKRKESQA